MHRRRRVPRVSGWLCLQKLVDYFANGAFCATFTGVNCNMQTAMCKLNVVSGNCNLKRLI